MTTMTTTQECHRIHKIVSNARVNKMGDGMRERERSETRTNHTTKSNCIDDANENDINTDNVKCNQNLKARLILVATDLYLCILSCANPQ